MYGVVFSFKDPFDTKDMRTTAGGDAAYDIDFPARDHILVEQLRNKGAIIFAKAVCTEYNGRAGNPGGRHEPEKVLPSTLGYQRSTWGGNPANPYDTTRAASLGSSSGSGVSVSANLVMCSLGEETRASCRGPANHNAVALILPHKAMLGFDGGAIGADIYCDRSGILARTIADCAKVLDALKDAGRRLLRPARPLHDGAALVGAGAAAMPRMHATRARRVRSRACASASSASRCWCGPARRRRCRSAPPPRPRSNRCSATSSARPWSNRAIRCGSATRDIEQMNPDFRQGLARLVPVFMPDLLFRLGADGDAGVQGIRRRDPADRVRCPARSSARHDGADRLLRRARRGAHRAAAQPRHRHDPGPGAGDDASASTSRNIWPPRRRLAGARLHRDARPISPRSTRARNSGAMTAAPPFKNWEEVADPRNPLGGRQGVDERIMLRELLRRLDMMVMLENRLDALVRLHTPLPPAKIGGAHDPLGGPQQSAAGNVVRPQCRADRDADPGRLCDDGLRPGVQAQRRRHALRPGAGRRRRRRLPAAGPAVLAGVPRRARPRGRRARRSPPPTKPPRGAASRRPLSVRCRKVE